VVSNAREIVIISACLFGWATSYTGKHHQLDGLEKLAERYTLLPLCPEQLAGLPTPRIRHEIRGGDGLAVWQGRARVVNEAGGDASEAFMHGARQAAVPVRLYGVRRAILKAKSPSCGVHTIYNGSFNRTLLAGMGVFTALLLQLGVACTNETQPV